MKELKGRLSVANCTLIKFMPNFFKPIFDAQRDFTSYCRMLLIFDGFVTAGTEELLR